MTFKNKLSIPITDVKFEFRVDDMGGFWDIQEHPENVLHPMARVIMPGRTATTIARYKAMDQSHRDGDENITVVLKVIPCYTIQYDAESAGKIFKATAKVRTVD